MTKRKRILFLGNNRLGWQVARWLKSRDENIVGLVLHPPHRQKYSKQIISSTGVRQECIFDGSRFHETEILNRVKNLEADIGISVLFGYILKRDFLSLLPEGCINIHPSLLPYNRGAHPNIWSIVEETPAGVTIHYIDSGLDTGDIVAQVQLEIEPVDTGESLYKKLEQLAFELFKKTWPAIKSGKALRIQQDMNGGTFHLVRDFNCIDEIDLDQTYKAKDLINTIRALTFPPYPGAYFKKNGRKVYLRLHCLYEDELKISNDKTGN